MLVRTIQRYIWGADDETIAYCVCMFVYMYVYTNMKHKRPVEEVIIFSYNICKVRCVNCYTVKYKIAVNMYCT